MHTQRTEPLRRKKRLQEITKQALSAVSDPLEQKAFFGPGVRRKAIPENLPDPANQVLITAGNLPQQLIKYRCLLLAGHPQITGIEGIGCEKLRRMREHLPGSKIKYSIPKR